MLSPRTIVLEQITLSDVDQTFYHWDFQNLSSSWFYHDLKLGKNGKIRKNTKFFLILKFKKALFFRILQISMVKI